MKKLLFVASTLNTGGAQKILSNLVMNLPAEYEATIVLNDTEDIVYPYKGRMISLGFREQANKLSIFYQFRVFLKRIQVLRQLKNTGEYTATISFLDSANFANILSGKRKSKVLVSVHNNLSESAVSWVYRYIVNPMVKILYYKADRVIAVSKGIEYDLIHNLGLSPDNVTTIYNGHDIESIRKQAKYDIPQEMAGVFKEGPVVATMGRLEHQKGQWHLIRAMAKVKTQIANVKLIILGDGELKPYLERLIAQYGLQANVVIAGFLDNPFCVLRKSDIFVLPSLYEGFPNALIEALSVGIPCVCSDFRSGAREILAPDLPVQEQNMDDIRYEKYGVLVPVCDEKLYESEELTCEEQCLAQGIVELLSKPEICAIYRERAAESVERLGSGRMVKEWMRVIEK